MQPRLPRAAAAAHRRKLVTPREKVASEANAPPFFGLVGTASSLVPIRALINLKPGPFNPFMRRALCVAASRQEIQLACGADEVSSAVHFQPRLPLLKRTRSTSL